MHHFYLYFLLLCSYILQTANLKYSPRCGLFKLGQGYSMLNEECGNIAIGEQKQTVIKIYPYIFYNTAGSHMHSININASMCDPHARMCTILSASMHGPHT